MISISKEREFLRVFSEYGIKKEDLEIPSYIIGKSDEDIMKMATVIFAMDEEIKSRILSEFPLKNLKVRLFSRLAGLNFNVEDPSTQATPERLREMLALIDRVCEKRLEFFLEGARIESRREIRLR